MLRWFKKRQEKGVSENKAVPKKDEYGFDGESAPCFIRQVEHIYEEIPDIPGSSVKFGWKRGGKKNRLMANSGTGPELPPRNCNRPAKHRSTYAQWRFQTLSRKTLSLPELVDSTDNGAETVLPECNEDFVGDVTIATPDCRTVRQFERAPKPCHLLPEHENSLENLVAEFDRTIITGFQDGKYCPQESDSGYDYSGSSSNGSDVNDSGLSGSYEFHLSKAEQLRRIEQEIHNLSCQSNSDFSTSLRSRDKLLKKRQKLFAEKIRNQSIGSLSSCASVTSDLDLDDETQAYGERGDFSSCEDMRGRQRHCSDSEQKSLPRNANLNVSHSQRQNTCVKAPERRKIPSKQRSIVNENARDSKKAQNSSIRHSCKRTEQNSVAGETTPRYQRPSGSNRLLGDLILKNNDNLFFA